MKKLFITICILFAAYISHAQVKDTGAVKPFDELPAEREQDSVITFFEIEPEFPGGREMMNLFIAKRLKYPPKARKKNITGRVYTQFTINEEGKMEDVRIVKSACECFNDEVIRVLKLMPPWKPATHNGVPVKTTYTLPFVFSLQ